MIFSAPPTAGSQHRLTQNNLYVLRGVISCTVPHKGFFGGGVIMLLAFRNTDDKLPIDLII